MNNQYGDVRADDSASERPEHATATADMNLIDLLEVRQSRAPQATDRVLPRNTITFNYSDTQSNPSAITNAQLPADVYVMRITGVPENRVFHLDKQNGKYVWLFSDRETGLSPSHHYTLPSAIKFVHVERANRFTSIVDTDKSKQEVDESLNKKPQDNQGPMGPGWDGRQKIVDPGFQWNPQPPKQKFEELPQVQGAKYESMRAFEALNRTVEPIVGGIADVSSGLRSVRGLEGYARALENVAMYNGGTARATHLWDAARATRAEGLYNLAGVAGAEFLKYQIDSRIFSESAGPGPYTWCADIATPMFVWNFGLAARLPAQFRVAGYIAKPLVVAGAHLAARIIDETGKR